MAAPVVAGAAASLLSQNRDIYKMPRNRARSDAIEKLLLVNCIKRGFGPEYEGFGMPDPAKV
jgi:subtilisin